MDHYVQCNERDVPQGVRFDTPRSNQGQIVEIAYGGFGKYEHGPGSQWKKIVDHSDHSTTYYRLAANGGMR